MLIVLLFVPGNIDRRGIISRGKGVGGSSLINGIAYSRGNRLDYDRWAAILNDSDWNYENVLPYFKKSETFIRTNPYVPVDKEYYGYHGPQFISQSSPPLNLTNLILSAGQELGYNIVDFNGKEQEGFSIMQYMIKDGKRFEPDLAFVFPSLHRKNLKVLDRAYVTNLFFSDNSTRAEGVIFTKNNATFIAKCSKEVILSAGAINSPQILMLSGIGPKEHLTSLGISVVQNLPVGNNLLDHPMTLLFCSSNITNEFESLEKSVRDLLKGQGVLSRVSFTDAIGFMTTPLQEIENYPDIEFIFLNITETGRLRQYFGFSDETIKALQTENSQGVFVVQFFNLNQKSLGKLRLNSSDPFEYPLIDLNLLSDENDVEILYQGIQIFLKLRQTNAFRSLNISLVIDTFPSCEAFEPLSREYWYCYIRSVSATGLHQVGTCSTGKDPSSGVVDSNLKVFGIDGLRVADASVIPLSLRAHINAPCTMIGEKVSDLIKKFHAGQNS